MSDIENNKAFELDTIDESLRSLSGETALGATVLSLGVIWHRDLDRIGAVAPLRFDNNGLAALSRITPEFRDTDGVGKSPLLDQRISRTPVTIKKLSERAFAIKPPEKRVKLRVNGQTITEATKFDMDELGDEIIIALSNAVILSLFNAPARGFSNARNSLGLLGVSKAMFSTRDAIARVAKSDIPVLIRGETGAGKELVARAIHHASARASKELVSVNMAAVAPTLAAAELFGVKKGAFTGAVQDKSGLFEQADRGSLFLDEIGDTPKEVQPMLLRTLEFGEMRRVGSDKTKVIDVRIIAATDRSLEPQEGEASFNQPLLQRLNGFSITIPPLRSRRVDIGILVRSFVEPMAGENQQDSLHVIQLKNMERLALHNWSGNVRELRNVTQQILLGHHVLIQLNDNKEDKRRANPGLSQPAGFHPKYKSAGEVTESELIDALNDTCWVIKDAAAKLNISRTALYEIMSKSKLIRSIENISDDELRTTVQSVQGGLNEWAKYLRVGRESLKRKLQNLKA